MRNTYIAAFVFGFLQIALVFWLCGCESTTQTAIRENQPPAIAYIVAPEQNNVRYIAIPEP